MEKRYDNIKLESRIVIWWWWAMINFIDELSDENTDAIMLPTL